MTTDIDDVYSENHHQTAAVVVVTDRTTSGNELAGGESGRGRFVVIDGGEQRARVLPRYRPARKHRRSQGERPPRAPTKDPTRVVGNGFVVSCGAGGLEPTATEEEEGEDGQETKPLLRLVSVDCCDETASRTLLGRSSPVSVGGSPLGKRGMSAVNLHSCAKELSTDSVACTQHQDLKNDTNKADNNYCKRTSSRSNEDSDLHNGHGKSFVSAGLYRCPWRTQEVSTHSFCDLPFLYQHLRGLSENWVDTGVSCLNPCAA